MVSAGLCSDWLIAFTKILNAKAAIFLIGPNLLLRCRYGTDDGKFGSKVLELYLESCITL